MDVRRGSRSENFENDVIGGTAKNFQDSRRGRVSEMYTRNGFPEKGTTKKGV